MSLKYVNVFISIVGFTEACWSGYQWLYGVEAMIGPIKIGPAEWFGLTVAGGLTALFAGYHFLKVPIAFLIDKFPSSRLRNLEIEIEIHRHDTRNISFHRSELLTKRMSLFFKLDSLKIDTPEIGNGRHWVIFLMHLQPLAEMGNIKAARVLLSKLMVMVDWEDAKI